MKAEQACFFGHIIEGSVPVVANERIGNLSLSTEPGAPQNQKIKMPIVIIVCLDQIQSAQDACEP